MKSALACAAIALACSLSLARPARADIISPGIEACMDKKVGDPCVDPGFGFGGDVPRSGFCVRAHDSRRNFDYFSCDTETKVAPAPEPSAKNEFARQPATPPSASATSAPAVSATSAPSASAAPVGSAGTEPSPTAEPPGPVPPRGAGCGCSLPGVGPSATVLGGLAFAAGILLGRGRAPRTKTACQATGTKRRSALR